MRAKQRERKSKSLVERFHAKYEIDENGCWIWQSKTRPDGYGVIWAGIEEGREVRAHRLSYEIHHGPIPEGLTVDHVCRVRACVNPEHLRLLTREDNVMVGIGPAAENARKTICKRGHLLTDDNVYVTRSGYRNCRECHRLYERVRRAEIAKNGSAKGIASKF